MEENKNKFFSTVAVGAASLNGLIKGATTLICLVGLLFLSWDFFFSKVFKFGILENMFAFLPVIGLDGRVISYGLVIVAGLYVVGLVYRKASA